MQTNKPRNRKQVIREVKQCLLDMLSQLAFSAV
jgi:hypothetical protein